MVAPKLSRKTTLAAKVAGGTRLRPVGRNDKMSVAAKAAARAAARDGPASQSKARVKKASVKTSTKKKTAKKSSSKKSTTKKAAKKKVKAAETKIAAPAKKTYAGMITDAIIHIRTYNKGASRPAIKAYVEEKYDKVLENHLFRSSLTKLIASDVVHQDGQRFKIDAAQRTALKSQKKTRKKSTAKKAKKASAPKSKKAAPRKAAPKKAKKSAPPALRRASSFQVVASAGLSESAQIYIDESKTVYEANLAVVNMETNTDKFYKLQVVQDGEGNTSMFHVIQNWGRTGTSGQTQTQSYSTVDAAVKAFEKKFREKSGASFADRETYTPASGKYSFVKKDFKYVQKGKVMWKYYVADGVDGKRTGWYDYAQEASDTVEGVYREWKNNPEGWLNIRSIQSGFWAYKIDFNEMEQTNTSTSKTREIRRSVDGKFKA